ASSSDTEEEVTGFLSGGGGESTTAPIPGDPGMGAVGRLAGPLAVARLEAGDTAAAVQDLLLARVERVAVGADLDGELVSRQGAPSGEGVSTTAAHLGERVVGVNARLHMGSSLRWPPGRPCE